MRISSMVKLSVASATTAASNSQQKRAPRKKRFIMNDPGIR